MRRRRRRRFTTTSFTAAQSPRSILFCVLAARAFFNILKCLFCVFFLTGYILLCLESARARTASLLLRDNSFFYTHACKFELRIKCAYIQCIDAHGKRSAHAGRRSMLAQRLGAAATNVPPSHDPFFFRM